MKISANAPKEAARTAKSTGASETASSMTAASTVGGARVGELQSGILQPALTAMREMPEVDEVRVAELRDALARGDVAFDVKRLAKLIADFHRTKS